MKAILVNYNFTPTWLLNQPEKIRCDSKVVCEHNPFGGGASDVWHPNPLFLDYHIYDRSDSRDFLKDFPQDRITVTENIGNVDLDKLNYLIDHYDDLPDVFLWGKTNLDKYVDPALLHLTPHTSEFRPLLKFDHKTYSDRNGIVCYYDDSGMYRERNDSWFLGEVPAKYVNSFDEWARIHNFTAPRYIPFPPGGNFILTKERVHRYGVDYYIKMRDMLNYAVLPGEAQCAERSYFLIWS